MAINHAMTHDTFSGRSDHVIMDCSCVTGEGDPARPYSMSLPGFLPHVWSRVAETLLYFEHGSWVANDVGI